MGGAKTEALLSWSAKRGARFRPPIDRRRRRPKIAGCRVAIARCSPRQQPLMMNEFVQQNLKDVGVDAEFEVVEWMSLLAVSRLPANAPENKARGIDAINVSRGFSDPYAGFQRLVDSRFTPPRGANWGMIKDPVIDGLDDQVLTTFDEEKRDDYLRQIHARIVDQAWMVFICHDLNPRALSPKVKGFVQAQSWSQDLTPIEIR
jgi:peptide/nickel transport system substrate-binding protein